MFQILIQFLYSRYKHKIFKYNILFCEFGTGCMYILSKRNPSHLHRKHWHLRFWHYVQKRGNWPCIRVLRSLPRAQLGGSDWSLMYLQWPGQAHWQVSCWGWQNSSKELLHISLSLCGLSTRSFQLFVQGAGLLICWLRSAKMCVLKEKEPDRGCLS